MPINDDDAATSRYFLKRFLSDTIVFLRRLALEENDVFIAEMREPLRLAWNDFEETFDIEFAFGRIDAISNADLESHGLYGNQLAFKLSTIDFWLAKFNLNKGWLKKLLEAIDNLLESLLEAAGLKGAIKEIKKGMELIINDNPQPLQNES